MLPPPPRAAAVMAAASAARSVGAIIRVAAAEGGIVEPDRRGWRGIGPHHEFLLRNVNPVAVVATDADRVRTGRQSGGQERRGDVQRQRACCRFGCRDRQHVGGGPAQPQL